MPDNNDNRTTMKSIGYTENFTWGSQKEQDKEQDPEPPVVKRHWGKYRGTVVENQDVPPRGRLLVSVPGIMTVPGWAMPCVPVATVLMGGGAFMRPAIDSNVWVEFERGDPDKPIWVGCFWGDADLPRMAKEYSAVPAAQAITLESLSAGISIGDIPIPGGGTTPGNINIVAGSGAVAIALTPGSLSVTAPVVTITAPTVTITTTTFSVVTPAGTFTVG
jgi:Type VI secretion system/phage-baseplate injector OB domain